MVPIKIAVLGAGFGAKVALPVYCSMEEFEPIGVWSRSLDRAVGAAEQFDIRVGTSDLESLLTLEDLEAVHIAVPPGEQLRFVRAAVDRGLHVICEKPMGRDLGEAKAIDRAIRSAGVVGVVDFELRFRGSRQRVAELVQSIVGVPRSVVMSSVHVDHADSASRPHTWVSEAAQGGGRIQAYGVHDLDLLLQMFPRVQGLAVAVDTAVKARETSSGDLRDVTSEDAYVMVLRLSTGGLVVAALVSTARHARGDLIEVHGDSGSVVLRPDGVVGWAEKGGDWNEDGPFDDSFETAFRQVAAAFWRAVRELGPVDPSPNDAIRVHEIVEEMQVLAV